MWFAHNRAVLHRRLGHIDAAQQLALQTLEIRSRLYGRDHWEAALTIHCVALTHRDQGRVQEAKALLREAAGVLERRRGREHPDTLAAMGDLADLCAVSGELEEARRLVEAVLAGRRRRVDQEPDSVTDRNDLAWLLLTCVPAELRDPNEALRLAQQASEMTEQTDPRALATLALALRRTGDENAAEEIAQKALSILPGDVPSDDPLREALERSMAIPGSALRDLGPGVSIWFRPM